MTEPTESPLLDLATAYAWHAVPDAERDDIERQVREAPQSDAEAFDDEVRAVQETMAIVSAATAAEPPAGLRAAVLGGIQAERGRSTRWRTTLLAAAAVVAVGLAAFGGGCRVATVPRADGRRPGAGGAGCPDGEHLPAARWDGDSRVLPRTRAPPCWC